MTVGMVWPCFENGGWAECKQMLVARPIVKRARGGPHITYEEYVERLGQARGESLNLLKE